MEHSAPESWHDPDEMMTPWQTILHRVSFIGSWGLLVFIVSVTAIHGQPDVDRRLQQLEDVRAERRLTAIETRLDGIEFIGKAILTVVCGQLVLQGLNLRTRRRP